MVENVYFPEGIETFEYPIISRTNLAEIPLLDEVLENLHPLPAYSLLLGLCERAASDPRPHRPFRRCIFNSRG